MISEILHALNTENSILGHGSIEFQIRNTLEMARIVGEYRQVVKDGGGTDEDIKI